MSVTDRQIFASVIRLAQKALTIAPSVMLTITLRYRSNLLLSLMHTMDTLKTHIGETKKKLFLISSRQTFTLCPKFPFVVHNWKTQIWPIYISKKNALYSSSTYFIPYFSYQKSVISGRLFSKHFKSVFQPKQKKRWREREREREKEREREMLWYEYIPHDKYYFAYYWQTKWEETKCVFVFYILSSMA